MNDTLEPSSVLDRSCMHVYCYDWTETWRYKLRICRYRSRSLPTRPDTTRPGPTRHDILFNIDLWLSSYGRKSLYFLVKTLKFNPKLLESAALSPLWPNFQKKKLPENQLILSKKSIQYLIFLCQIKPRV